MTTATMALAGCDIPDRDDRAPEQLPVSVDLGSAERSKIELNLGAGELKFGSGSSKLLEGTLQYHSEPARPEVRVSTVGRSTDITIRQPEKGPFPHGGHYSWDLDVNDRILLDLAINCGAGHEQLDLGRTNLRSLDVNIGAGQVDVDLRGTPKRDYDVTIAGGVGQATVNLPEQVGVWAEAHGGIGHIEVRGLEKKGDHWENALYDTAKVNVRVKVSGGIGEIRLLAD